MKTLTSLVLTLVASQAFAFGPILPTVNVQQSTDQMIRYASQAVADYAQDTYGLDSVEVTYDYEQRHFSAFDIDNECGFVAVTPINFTSGGWDVVELKGSNTCL